MKFGNYLKILIMLVLVGRLFNCEAGDIFYIKGNKVPLKLEIAQYEEHKGTIFFENEIILHLPYSELTLLVTKGELWNYNEETNEFQNFKMIISSQDLFSQLFQEKTPVSFLNRASLKVTIEEGSGLSVRVPFSSQKRYLKLETQNGEYISFGSLNFELKKYQLETELGLGLEEPALFMSGSLSGLGAFLLPISMAGFGISTSKVFSYQAKTKFGLDKSVLKEMNFKGQLAIVGSGEIPKLPVTLTAEFIEVFDGPINEVLKQGFNGKLQASYKFSSELGLSMQLGNASAYIRRPIFFGENKVTDIILSGVQNPKFSFFPADFPLQPGKEIKVAGRLSSNIVRSQIVAYTNFSIFKVPLSKGVLKINKSGLMATGIFQTPVSKIQFSGEVAKKKVNLNGSARAHLDVNGILRTVERFTDAGICGAKVITSGAKCGYQFLEKEVFCKVAKIPHNICIDNCKKNRIGGPNNIFTCELQCFSKVNESCKKAKKCKIAKSCDRVVKIPNTKLGYIKAEIALQISLNGLEGDVTAEFCPLKKQCATLPKGKVQLDVSDIKEPKICIGKGVAGSDKSICTYF